MLQKIQFKPGFNKQATATGAEGQWVDGDNVRFRYGQLQLGILILKNFYKNLI